MFVEPDRIADAMAVLSACAGGTEDDCEDMTIGDTQSTGVSQSINQSINLLALENSTWLHMS